MARDRGGGGQTLAAGASGGHRYLDGATGLEGVGEETKHDGTHLKLAENFVFGACPKTFHPALTDT